MAKKIVINEIIITASAPHQQYFAELVIDVVTAKYVGTSAIDIQFLLPRTINLSVLNIEVVNSKYVHLEDIGLSYITEKNTCINAIDLSLYHPKQSSYVALDIQHRMLQSMEMSFLVIDQILLPTRTRFHNVNVYAIKIPHKSFGAIDIALGFPYKIIEYGVPLNTLWSVKMRTEISGSLVTHRKIGASNIRAVYESATLYGGNDLGSRITTQIKAAISEVHHMKTDIYLDYSTWFTRYEKMHTNITSAGTLTHQQVSHIYVLGGTTKKHNVSILGKRGLYLDNINVSTHAMAYADLGSSKIWLRQQMLVGYTQFNSQVKYGVFVTIPNNINNLLVDKSYLGIPLTGNTILDLGVQINLLHLNTIDFDNYATPNEILNVFGVVLGSSGSFFTYQSYAYLDITDLTKRFQTLYTGGDMVLQIIPSNTLLHADMLLQKPFLYRVFNINVNSNFIYKIFNREVV